MMIKRELEIYVHIPFCVQKCSYCDFLSRQGKRKEQEEYIDVLVQEIENQAVLGREYEVVSIFFGGGTPSILPEQDIGRIMEKMREIFSISEKAEITVECNPGTLNKNKLEGYKKYGINRLSIGLQSADDDELKTLGRIHTWKDFLASWRAARDMGFGNINVDLMSGLPGQTYESWKKTLEQVAELKPEHISAYSLIIEPGTPFYERYEKHSELLPEEELEREMYYFTKSFLQREGYDRYEISNYARPGAECRHNTGYWTGIPYLGLGLGASSYIEGIRFANPSDEKEYEALVKQNVQAVDRGEKLTAGEQMEEFMFLGLRLIRGISAKEFERRFQASLFSVYGMVLSGLMEEGLIDNSGECYYLTEKGIDLSNYVMAKFLN